MDNLNCIADQATRFAHATELAQALTDCLSGITPRHSSRNAQFPDAERTTAFQDLCRAKDALNFNLRQLDEQRNMSLAPTARLDDDVLRTVFLLAFHAIDAPNKRMELAVAFTHVSRRWRRIAVDCAGLWADVHVAAHDRVEFQESPWKHIVSQYRPSQNMMLTTFLHRAKGIPLNVKIIDNPPSPLARMAQLGTRTLDVETRLPCIGRPIRTLVTERCLTNDVNGLLQSLSDSEESLAKVSLIELKNDMGTWTAGPAVGNHTEDVLRLKNVLELKAAKLREFEFHHSQSFPLSLPCFPRLTRLVVHIPNLSRSNILAILSYYPCLRTMQCTSDGYHEDPQEIHVPPSVGQPRTTMQHLEVLVLGLRGDIVCYMMDHMLLPSLRTLSLALKGRTGLAQWQMAQDPSEATRSAEATGSMLKASGTSVRELELYNLGSNVCLRILQDAPEVVSVKFGERTSLSFDRTSLERIATALAPDVGTACLNPLLETLEYNGAWRGSSNALHAMINSRISLNQSNPLACRTLRRVVLSTVPLSRMDTERLTLMASLLEDGLVVGDWEFRNGTTTWIGSPTSNEDGIPDRFRSLLDLQ